MKNKEKQKLCLNVLTLKPGELKFTCTLKKSHKGWHKYRVEDSIVIIEIRWLGKKF
jgi:hypothetical protein